MIQVPLYHKPLPNVPVYQMPSIKVPVHNEPLITDATDLDRQIITVFETLF